MRKLGRIGETPSSAVWSPLLVLLPLLLLCPLPAPPPKTPGATLSMRLLLRSSDRSDFKLLKIVDDSNFVRLLLRIDKWTRCTKLRTGKSCGDILEMRLKAKLTVRKLTSRMSSSGITWR